MASPENDTKASADKRPHGPQTSQTIGYDSAQKSGYDTAVESGDAERTTNEVDEKARATDLDRQNSEGEARRDGSKRRSP
jgi:hypothetical protein